MLQELSVTSPAVDAGTKSIYLAKDVKGVASPARVGGDTLIYKKE